MLYICTVSFFGAALKTLQLLSLGVFFLYFRSALHDVTHRGDEVDTKLRQVSTDLSQFISAHVQQNLDLMLKTTDKQVSNKAELLQLKLTPIICLMNFINKKSWKLKKLRPPLLHQF